MQKSHFFYLIIINLGDSLFYNFPMMRFAAGMGVNRVYTTKVVLNRLLLVRNTLAEAITLSALAVDQTSEVEKVIPQSQIIKSLQGLVDEIDMLIKILT